MAFKLAITGVKELDEQLRIIAESEGAAGINGTMKRAIRDAVKTIIEPEIRARVPVAKGAYWRPTSTRVAGREDGTFGDGSSTLVEPGFLLSQIKVRALRRSRNSFGYWCGFPDKLFTGDTYYAGYLEYGTKQRTTKHGANRGQITPDSFLRVPLYSNASRVIALAQSRMAAFVAERNRAA
jgi:hypothetical protein